MRKIVRHEIGAAAEDVFDKYAQAAANQKVARFWKIPTPTKNVRGRIVYEEKSTVDYEGFLLDGTARHLAVEVKSCRGDRFDLKNIKEHQKNHLALVHRAGGGAYLFLVCLEFSGTECFAMPWPVVASTAELRKSIPWADWQPWRVNPLSFASFLRRPSARTA